MPIGTITYTNDGTTNLNLSNYATLETGLGDVLTWVGVPNTCQEPKIVFSALEAFVTEGEAPNAQVGFSYWDLSSTVTPVVLEIDLLGGVDLTSTVNSALESLPSNGIFNGQILFAASNLEDTVTSSYPTQGYLVPSGTSGTATYTAALPPSYSGNTNLINPPFGASFFTASGSVQNFVLEENGQDFGTSGYGTTSLLDNINGGLGGDTQAGAFSFFSWVDSTSKTSTILMANFFAEGADPYSGVNAIELTDYNGTGQDSYVLELEGKSAPFSVQGAIANGYYGFFGGDDPDAGSLGVLNPISRSYEVFTFSPQDTVATACLTNCQMEGLRLGCLVSNSAGSLILTTCGTWYEFTPTTNTFLAAISSPGSGPPPPPSMALTLTTISGTHGTPLTLGGTYNYVDTVAPTALDIGYIQDDDTILWVDAQSSTIGTSTPVGGFTTLGGTLA